MRFRPKLSPYSPVVVRASRAHPGSIYLYAEGDHLVEAEARRVAAALIREADKIEKGRRK